MGGMINTFKNFITMKIYTSYVIGLNFCFIFCRGTVNVTFFNNLADAFEKQYNAMLKEPVVIIIAAAKVNQYDGINAY